MVKTKKYFASLAFEIESTKKDKRESLLLKVETLKYTHYIVHYNKPTTIEVVNRIDISFNHDHSANKKKKKSMMIKIHMI